MAKLAASEAATAIAHQVTTVADVLEIQHAERDFVFSQVFEKGGMEFTR